MKITNTSKRLICFQTNGGRVEVLPGVVTDNKNLDALKGKNKIFDHYLKKGVIKEVAEVKKTPKEILIEKAVSLGVEVDDSMTKAELEAAIKEAEEDL